MPGLREVAFFAGGFAIFLLGIHRARSAFERASGGRLRAALELLTRRPIVAAAAGFALALVTQSSSAAAVILIGMAGSSLVPFDRSVGALLGADLASTLTVQVMAFEVESWSLLAIAAGVLLVLASRARRTRELGDAILGLGFVLYGMSLMKTAASPLGGAPGLSRVLAGLSDRPALGLAAGIAATAVLQSSAAMVGIVLALAQAGALTLEAALCIVLGANVGTAATGLLASAASGRDGKRVALAHLFEKLAGTLLVWPFLDQLGELARAVAAWTGGSEARAIAHAHTLFNAGKLVLFLPLARLFARAAELVLPARPGPPPRALRHLADTSRDGPGVVLVKVARELADALEKLAALFPRVLGAFEEATLAELDSFRAADEETDAVHEAVVSNLRRISREELSGAQVAELERLLYVARDLEELGDSICIRLAAQAEAKLRAGGSFSIEGELEFRRLGAEVGASLAAIAGALRAQDRSALAEVAERERGMDARAREAARAHFRREVAGIREAVETDTVFADSVAELRRIHMVIADMATVLAGVPATEGARPAARGSVPGVGAGSRMDDPTRAE